MADLIDKWETMRALLQAINPVTTPMDGEFIIRISEVENFLEHMTPVQPDTTTHDSISAKTGENDGDKTSGDCIDKQAEIDAFETVKTVKAENIRCEEENSEQYVAWLKILKKAKFEYDEAWRIITHPTPDVTYADKNRARIILDTFKDSLGMLNE